MALYKARRTLSIRATMMRNSLARIAIIVIMVIKPIIVIKIIMIIIVVIEIGASNLTFGKESAQALPNKPICGGLLAFWPRSM